LINYTKVFDVKQDKEYRNQYNFLNVEQ